MKLDTIDRRDLLKLAAGLGLSFTLPAMELRAATRRGDERPKSLLTIWLSGGPSQLETWDPHPGSPTGGPTKSIKTALPGVEIAEHYPRLADRLDRLSVIRSLVSKEGDHSRGTYYLKTGYRPDPTVVHPAAGAIVAYEMPNAQLEIPQFISLGYNQHPSRGGYLGSRYDAFQVFNPGESAQNLRMPVDEDRQKRRLSNLDVVGQSFARGRLAAVQQTLHQDNLKSALQMMTSDQLQAFQPESEPQAIRDAYGDSPFGRGCLVARRLIEQGVRAVEVTMSNFDTHDNNFEIHRQHAGALDPALSALLDDLVQRDLLQSTVVLCIGEFGRTPKINAQDGRDHWPNGFSCLVGGGGLTSGVFIGATDPSGQRRDPQDPIQVPDLFATVLQTLGISPTEEVLTPVGRPIKFSDGTPIKRLLAS